MKYAAKHPLGSKPDPAIAAALDAAAVSERVSCSRAHQLAESLHVSPGEIGKTMDLLELRIVECQMGIFGYQPEKKVLVAAEVVSEELRDLLMEAAPDGYVSCVTCWSLASGLGMEKEAVAAACERLGLKIKPCQLGAF